MKRLAAFVSVMLIMTMCLAALSEGLPPGEEILADPVEALVEEVEGDLPARDEPGGSSVSPAYASGNLAHFVQPRNGDVVPCGRLEIYLTYDVDGMYDPEGKWLGDSALSNYMPTLLSVVRDGEGDVITIRDTSTIVFSDAGRCYATVTLNEPGVYTLGVASPLGTGDPETIVITVTDSMPTAVPDDDPENSNPIYDPDNSVNPGYHIFPEKTEYTINLAETDILRIHFTLSCYKQVEDPGFSSKEGCDEEGATVVIPVDWTRDKIVLEEENGAFVGSGFFDYKAVKVGTAAAEIGIIVAEDGVVYVEDCPVTIHVIDDPAAVTTPAPTEAPTASPKSTASAKPTATAKPTVSPKPTESAMPTESVKPAASEKPADSIAPTAAPTATPVPTHAPGDTVKLKSGSYRLLSDGTVKFMKPADKAAKTAKIPATVTIDGRKMKVSEIAPKAFYRNKALTKVTIGKTVKTVGKSAFYGCANLKSVKGGAGIVTIGASAFKGCKALTAIVLNRSVKSVGKSAFHGCAKLKKVTIKATGLTVANVGKAAFKGIYAKAVFRCPKSKLQDYAALLAKRGAPKKATCRAA